ncbi:hypothetical protein HPB48_013118 [Haemaphysalis longicornis]|uniref:Uncharacterized protein n=1 Tax=Haemaphysalis longicornis TaxID=44386 RepID=A0A9J6GAN5_HAELO|nr:hypothetical protein HPB48_013118 [Haemaphysalis longicornis]
MKRIPIDICSVPAISAVSSARTKKSKRCVSFGHYVISQDVATDCDDLVLDSYGRVLSIASTGCEVFLKTNISSFYPKVKEIIEDSTARLLPVNWHVMRCAKDVW